MKPPRRITAAEFQYQQRFEELEGKLVEREFNKIRERIVNDLIEVLEEE